MESSSAGGLNNMALTLLSTQSGTNQATMSFTSGIDSTYLLYLFRWTDVNPATDQVEFSFQVNAAAASGFNETVTSTYWRAYQQENDGSAGVGYESANDQAQGTGYQYIAIQMGAETDECGSGILHIFNPSSTTYVKNWYARLNNYAQDDSSRDIFTSGYFNLTTAIDEISFKMSSGNFDGVIQMYGIS